MSRRPLAVSHSTSFTSARLSISFRFRCEKQFAPALPETRALLSEVTARCVSRISPRTEPLRGCRVHRRFGVLWCATSIPAEIMSRTTYFMPSMSFIEQHLQATALPSPSAAKPPLPSSASRPHAARGEPHTPVGSGREMAAPGDGADHSGNMASVRVASMAALQSDAALVQIEERMERLSLYVGTMHSRIVGLERQLLRLHERLSQQEQGSGAIEPALGGRLAPSAWFRLADDDGDAVDADAPVDVLSCVPASASPTSASLRAGDGSPSTARGERTSVGKANGATPTAHLSE
ncbi:hypothetical protein CDCA_CDCA11G3238 [Cyanidium caldarium]|uniref:Uncharacterized protein n=1 Tax=Cyanidium caldarium TaxID=2771 RepID=A0AAV9IZJ2_CYACA|nr:hypothetical protein CDCA_CDCA11G3238 [Cyanidium caldarium]